MEQLNAKAMMLGALDFGLSDRKDKRFFVLYNGQVINFGSKHGRSFIDHGDENIKNAWYARHSKIKNKVGELVINLKTSPSYWSHKILWS
jgi:hypothetical protein